MRTHSSDTLDLNIRTRLPYLNSSTFLIKESEVKKERHFRSIEIIVTSVGSIVHRGSKGKTTVYSLTKLLNLTDQPKLMCNTR